MLHVHHTYFVINVQTSFFFSISITFYWDRNGFKKSTWGPFTVSVCDRFTLMYSAIQWEKLNKDWLMPIC